MSAPTGNPRPEAGQLNRLYGTVLRWMTRLGLVVLVVGFALYVTGVLPGYVPPADVLPALDEPALAYAAHKGIPTGWAWLAYLNHGDMLTLLGLALLIGSVVVAYLTLLAVLLRRRNWVYVVLVVLQLAIFVLAGSGLVGGG